MKDRRFFARWDLLLPAVLAPVAEVSLVRTLGLDDAASLAPQITAPPPFGLFHDLRWVSVYHNSWWMLAIELVAVLVLRSLWVAFMVQRAWPTQPVPAMAQAVRRVVIYKAVAAVLLVPWVILLFGLALTHLSFLFFAALPPVIAIAIAIHGGALRAGGRFPWGPTGVGLAWILGAFLWLTAAGALISEAPTSVAILIAALAGLANARAWYGIVHEMARPTERVRIRALSAGLVAFTLVVAVGGTALGFSLATNGRAEDWLTAPRGEPIAGSQPVLVAPGLFGIPKEDRQIELPDGFAVSYFSYRGLDGEGNPLPYRHTDTLQPILASAEKMAAHVRLLTRTYRRPVTIVAESAGALVARMYLVRLYDPHRDGAVARLITLNMPSGPAEVYFPAPGRQGWGVGSGWALRGLTALIDGFAPFEISADSPILREAAECSGLFAQVLTSPLPTGIEEVSIEALADWVDRPERNLGNLPVHVVNRPHGGLIYDVETQALLGNILRGRVDAPPRHSRFADLLSAVSSPWLLPRLDARLAPGTSCPAVQ